MEVINDGGQVCDDGSRKYYPGGFTEGLAENFLFPPLLVGRSRQRKMARPALDSCTVHPATQIPSGECVCVPVCECVYLPVSVCGETVDLKVFVLQPQIVVTHKSVQRIE